MGNACCRNTTSDDDSDRAQIISNDYDTSHDAIGGHGGAGGDGPNEFYINFAGQPVGDEIPYGSFSCDNKTQEQAALDRIYHKLALNVIDVAPGETMIIQPAEICARQNAYQSRLNKLGGLPSLTLNKTGGVQNYGHLFNHNKLVSKLKISSSLEPTSGESGDGGANITAANRQKLYQIPDRRRVEYDAIPQEEEQLIREYSLRSVRAVKSLAPIMNEPVIKQFNL